MRSLISLIFTVAIFLGGVYVGAKHHEAVSSTFSSVMGSAS